MPENRYDPCSGRWVILAEDRAGRPSEFLWRPQRQSIARCPFCAGNESETPATVATYPSLAPAADWQVRVIPNKYPAAVSRSLDDFTAAPIEEHDQAAAFSPFFVSEPASGAHEVIIESPQHVTSFSELTPDQSRWAVLAYRDRLQHVQQMPGIAYALVFKNCRGAGGATLEHAHSQLLATSILPTEPGQEVDCFRQHFRVHGRCLLCDLQQAEHRTKVRMVTESNGFVVYCPFASRFPYETWIVPRQHLSRFDTISSDEAAEIAALLQQHIRALERLFPELAYNFWFQSSPASMECSEYFHWRLVIIARTSTQAGYEWGTGCFVNPVAPETAAKRLRAVW